MAYRERAREANMGINMKRILKILLERLSAKTICMGIPYNLKIGFSDISATPRSNIFNFNNNGDIINITCCHTLSNKKKK